MKVGELFWGNSVILEAVDDLDEKLVEFLPGNGANFEMIEALN